MSIGRDGIALASVFCILVAVGCGTGAPEVAAPAEGAAGVAVLVASASARAATARPTRAPTLTLHDPAVIAVTKAADAAPTRPPHTPLPTPKSCPRKVEGTSVIIRPLQGIPGVRIAIATQAGVIVGQEQYSLTSGSAGEDRRQGVIYVFHPVYDSCAHPELNDEMGLYPAPTKHGALTMTAIDGVIVTYRTADGTTGQFNVVTKQYTEDNPGGATPGP